MKMITHSQPNALPHFPLCTIELPNQPPATLDSVLHFDELWETPKLYGY